MSQLYRSEESVFPERLEESALEVDAESTRSVDSEGRVRLQYLAQRLTRVAHREEQSITRGGRRRRVLWVDVGLRRVRYLRIVNGEIDEVCGQRVNSLTLVQSIPIACKVLYIRVY